MHELSIAQGIVEIAEHHLPPHSGRVTSVRMKIGALAGVVVDSLTFCFAAITAGTRLQGARLDIEQVPITVRCSRCGAVTPVTDTEFACGSCGEGTITVVTGRELQVTELELSDEPE